MGNTFVKPGKSTERAFDVSDVVITLRCALSVNETFDSITMFTRHLCYVPPSIGYKPQVKEIENLDAPPPPLISAVINTLIIIRQTDSYEFV